MAYGVLQVREAAGRRLRREQQLVREVGEVGGRHAQPRGGREQQELRLAQAVEVEGGAVLVRLRPGLRLRARVKATGLEGGAVLNVHTEADAAGGCGRGDRLRVELGRAVAERAIDDGDAAG